MKAEIKSIHLVNKWDASEADKEFYSNIEVEIGPAGVMRSDIFNIDVCNFIWIYNNIKGLDSIFIRKLLLVNDFSETFLADIISKKIASIHAECWEELAKKLSLSFNWEYDNYVD